MYKFHVKCQIWRHASSPCFKAVRASPKLYYIAHKLACETKPILLLNKCYRAFGMVLTQLESSLWNGRKDIDVLGQCNILRATYVLN